MMNQLVYSAGVLACSIGVVLMAASPVAAASASQIDLSVLNYALTLEHLEYAFYRDGVALLRPSSHSDKASTRRERFLYERLADIRDHEGAHVQALNATIIALGGTPVKECKYEFGYKTKKDFLAIARVLENVGVSAYLGAAYKIDSPTLLTVAASITTIEARHASILNQINHLDPFPNAFDSPLDMRAVIGLASGFFISCPQNVPVTPYPALTVIPTVARTGSRIQVQGRFTNSTVAHCVFYSGSASINSTLEFGRHVSDGVSAGRCHVPAGVPHGDNFVFLMTSEVYDLTNSNGILGGPALLVIK